MQYKHTHTAHHTLHTHTPTLHLCFSHFQWPSGKEAACQCGKHESLGFDPWVGKIPWRRAWQPTLVFLPGESHWTEEPGRLQFIGSQNVGHNWSNLVCMHDSLLFKCTMSFYTFEPSHMTFLLSLMTFSFSSPTLSTSSWLKVQLKILLCSLLRSLRTQKWLSLVHTYVGFHHICIVCLSHF